MGLCEYFLSSATVIYYSRLSQRLHALLGTFQDNRLSGSKVWNVPKDGFGRIATWRRSGCPRLCRVPFETGLDLISLARLKSNDFPALKAKGLPVPASVSILRPDIERDVY